MPRKLQWKQPFRRCWSACLRWKRERRPKYLPGQIWRAIDMWPKRPSKNFASHGNEQKSKSSYWNSVVWCRLRPTSSLYEYPPIPSVDFWKIKQLVRFCKFLLQNKTYKSTTLFLQNTMTANQKILAEMEESAILMIFLDANANAQLAG